MGIVSHRGGSQLVFNNATTLTLWKCRDMLDPAVGHGQPVAMWRALASGFLAEGVLLFRKVRGQAVSARACAGQSERAACIFQSLAFA